MRIGRILWLTLSAVWLASAIWLVPTLEDYATVQKTNVVRIGVYFLAALTFVTAFAYRQIGRRLELLADAARSRFHGVIEYSAHPSRLELALIWSIAAALIALTTLVFWDEAVAVRLAEEDGIIENATSVFYLIASAANLTLLMRFCGRTLLRLNLGLLALLFFVVGMEEISWGQRILNIETPAALRDINVQGELTLHNIWSTSLTTYPALLVTAVLLCLLPLLAQYNYKARSILQAFQFPVAAAIYGYLYVATVAAYFAIGFRLGVPTPIPISWHGISFHIDEEYLELFISCLFVTASLGSWRLVRSLPETDTQ